MAAFIQKYLPATIGFILFGMFVGIVIYWFNAGNFGQLDTTPNADDVTKAIDMTLAKNGADFGTWYKANTLIQCGSIFTGVAATILAALTTAENAQGIKIFTVTLTAITAILVSSQSIFHIKENLDTFIKVNSDLENLKIEYIVQRDTPREKPDPTAFNRYVADVRKKLMASREARLRAYAIIGPQQNSNLPPAPVPPGPNKEEGENAKKPK